MSDSSRDAKLKSVEAALDKGLLAVRQQLIEQIKGNPDFFGSASLELSLRAGSVVSSKHSVEVVQKV